MTTASDVENMAARVVHRQQLDPKVMRILARSAVAATGDAAWRITLVVKPRNLTGDEALDFLVGIQNAFQEHGEMRSAIIDYATEADLAAEAAEAGEAEENESEEDG